MQVTALIPVKSFRNAKQRLSPLLGSREREFLAEAMFRDVLRQITRTQGIAETYVVTPDGRVSEIARSFGASVIREPTETGETGAVDLARLRLREAGHEATWIMPGDLPLVQSEDIQSVLSHVPQSATPPFALLVPSHDRMGTNGLLLAPPDLIELRFGYDSFSYHMSQVSAHGLPIRFIENDHLALDIDEPKDLERFLSFEQEGEAFQFARRALANHEMRRTRRCGAV